VASLEKSFGSVRVLERVDLRVEPGSGFALLGPNGAGKTTIVRILATLTLPDAGSARIDGLDVVADLRALRPRISLAGQYAALDELQTGEENLRMLGRLDGRPGSSWRGSRMHSSLQEPPRGARACVPATSSSSRTGRATWTTWASTPGTTSSSTRLTQVTW
jgi:ABC-2 type transport system ATP-binding protein